MKFAAWILRLALFLGLFGLALQNTAPVTLHLLFGYTWQAPLILILLVVFAIGAVLGLLSSALPHFFRRRNHKDSSPISAGPHSA